MVFQSLRVFSRFAPLFPCIQGKLIYNFLWWVYIADVDECQEESCQGVAKCKNTPGSFECQCPGGYTLSRDRLSCEGLYLIKSTVMVWKKRLGRISITWLAHTSPKLFPQLYSYFSYGSVQTFYVPHSLMWVFSSPSVSFLFLQGEYFTAWVLPNYI